MRGLVSPLRFSLLASLISLLILAFGSVGTSHAAVNTFQGCVPSGSTITVNSTADQFTTPSILFPGTTCSLREALTSANSDSNVDDTIVLSNVTYTLDRDAADPALNPNGHGDLDVLSKITITGNGATITRDTSKNAFRIFDVGDVADGTFLNGNLTLNNVTISHGDAGADNGGGIRVSETGVLLAGNNNDDTTNA